MKKLQKICSHVDLVIKNRDLYLEKEKRTIDSLLQLLSQDAAVLEINDIIEVSNFHGWGLIATPFDWVLINNTKTKSWKEAFSRLIHFPEGGINAIRHEIFLMVFTQNIFVRSEGIINVIKGNGLDDEKTRLINEKFPKDYFVIGFSGIEIFK